MNNPEEIKPVRAWRSLITGAIHPKPMYFQPEDRIVEVEIRPVQQPEPIAHDKAEAGEMECAGFKRMMSECSSDIMSKIIASENKSIERDFEIWWKQEWSFGEEPSAAEVYAILKKCTINVKRNRKALEDKIEALEENLFLKEECRRNEQSQLMKKNAELEAEVARLDSLKCKAQVEALELKGKLEKAREAGLRLANICRRFHYSKELAQAYDVFKESLSSLNEADETKENG